MPISPVFDRVFSTIYGKPCWNVTAGHGSFLTLEFRRPYLVVRKPKMASAATSARVLKELARRRVFVHGQWHLWIYCCDWEVISGGERIGDSSTKLKMRPATELLDGQKLTRFSFSPSNLQCIFNFDLGAILRTTPYDDHSEQWSLYTPRHRVLTLRADRRYQYDRSDRPPDEGVWKSALV